MESQEKFIELLLNKMKDEFVKNKMPLDLFLNIANKFSDLDYDTEYLSLVLFHLNNVLKYMPKEKEGFCFSKFVDDFNSHEDCIQYQVSSLFISKLYLHPCGEPASEYKENFKESIDSLPIELFFDHQKFKGETEKGLTRNDIVYVEVSDMNYLQIGQPMIQTRMIYKEGEVKGFVYHLDIKIYLIRQYELERFPQLNASSFLRVAIIGSTLHSNVLHCFATSNQNFIQGGQVQLGPVDPTDKNLPFNVQYLKKNPQFSAYAAYLRSHPVFYETKTVDEDIESVGIDINKWSTFSDDKKRLEVPPDQCIAALEEKAKRDLHPESKKHYEIACLHMGKKDFRNALVSFEKALKCWPQNYKVYLRRGMLYKSMLGKDRKKELRIKAMSDFEQALSFNPTCEEAKIELSEQMAYKARCCLKSTNRKEGAKKFAEVALQYNNNNESAKKVIEYIDRKVIAAAKVVEDLEKLEEEKEILQAQIKTERC